MGWGGGGVTVRGVSVLGSGGPVFLLPPAGSTTGTVLSRGMSFVISLMRSTVKENCDTFFLLLMQYKSML